LAEDPPALELIYLHEYFQIFIYFTSQDICIFRNLVAIATATLVVTHPPLRFTCPIVGKREKSWCGEVVYVEQLGRVAIVERDDAGKGTRVATENEEEALNTERVCQARALPWDETEVF
jgi:hypothetical protein